MSYSADYARELEAEVGRLRAAIKGARPIAEELARQPDWLADGHRASDYGHDILIAFDIALGTTDRGDPKVTA